MNEDDELLSYDKKVQKCIKSLTQATTGIRRENKEADKQREEAIRVAKFLVGRRTSVFKRLSMKAAKFTSKKGRGAEEWLGQSIERRL